jgi:glycosyltransferase involved in cell wall biosynthesis
MISVIVPVYNGEKTIGRCLEALLRQTKKPDEIIVVDDGSKDQTRAMAKKFSGVILLEQEHMGPAAARNTGARKARGDILLFIDSDCMASENWVAEMVKPFENKEVSGVQGRYRTEQKGVIARFAQLEIEDRYDRMRKKSYIDFIGSYAAGYRKDVFLKCGGFDEAFSMASGEDPELSFKLAKAGHKMVFNANAVVYHKHVASLEAYLKQKFWRAYWRVLLYKKHPSKIKGESYTPQALKLEIALFSLFGLGLLLSFLFSVMLYLSLASLMALVITALPLSYKNFRKEKTIGVITPVMSLLRAMVFCFGLAYGVLRL